MKSITTGSPAWRKIKRPEIPADLSPKDLAKIELLIKALRKMTRNLRNRQI